LCRDSSNPEPVTYQELRAILKALQREFMCNHRNAFGLCFWAQKKPLHIAKYLASTTFQA